MAGGPRVYHYAGICGYVHEALQTHLTAPEGGLNTAVELEQLGFREAGIPIKCIEVVGHTQELLQLNNPVELARSENILT